MLPTNSKMKKKAFAVMVALVALVAGATANAQENNDPRCGATVHYPGAVTVVGKAWGTAQEGDFRICSTTYRCGANAKKVEVFGFGYSSHREGVISTENYAVASDSSEAILASCNAAAQGSVGKLRSCLAEKQRFQSQAAVAEEATCSVAVGAPAQGWTGATATCFCEG